MSNNIESENLTITLPYDVKCNKKCPYCISNITPQIVSNPKNWLRNLKKARHVAENAGVGSVMITGKTEPSLLINTSEFNSLCEYFVNFPLEIQINNVLASQRPKIADQLYHYALNTIAVSIDALGTSVEEKILKLEPFFVRCRELGMVTRVSINVTDQFTVFQDYSFIDDFFDLLNKSSIDQLLFRNIVTPQNIFTDNEKIQETISWISENTRKNNYRRLENMMAEYIRDGKFPRIRRTKWGMDIYDIKGVSFGVTARCIQEESEYNKIRSLIYQADGHLYTSWNSLCKLF